MAVVRIATNFNIDIEFTAPAFYRRLLAWVIDLVIQIIYFFIALKIVKHLSEGWRNGRDFDYNIQFAILIILVPFFIYHPVSEILMGGQSIGKKIVGIKVISETGGKPSLGQYAIRWLIRTADLFILIILVMIPLAAALGPQVYYGIIGGLLLFLADVILVNMRRQQRVGDILAHTLLINTRQNESINDTIFLDISDKYVPSFPQVMQLSDRDINSLKGILDTARKRHDFNLAELASNKIQRHLNIETTLSPFDFLEVLLKDYNYLSAN